MKLATLDDLLAEIGLGNAMSVVVAKNLQHGDASIPPATQSHGHLPIKGADGVLITLRNAAALFLATRLSPTSAPVKVW